MKQIIIIVIVIVAVLGIGFWLFSAEQGIQENLPGVALENQGQEHIAQGSTDHPAYNSNPPTSGWHWPQPAAWGSYATAQSDEQLIHNLEHGGIWISYKPDLDAQTIAQLNDFAKRYRKIIVAPRVANDSAIALAGWARLQKLDRYDERLILQFIDAFYDKGPEKVD